MAEGQTPPGWYPDTQNPGQQRYWDGAQWTDNFAPLVTAPVVAPAKKGHGCLYAILGAVAVVGLLAVIIAVAIGGAADKVADDLTKSRKEALKEVKIATCSRDALGDVDIKGTAHNTSSGRSNYLIDVVVEDSSGTQLDSSVAITNNVDPNQTARWQALTTAKFAPGVTCKVASVIRTASVQP